MVESHALRKLKLPLEKANRTPAPRGQTFRSKKVRAKDKISPPTKNLRHVDTWRRYFCSEEWDEKRGAQRSPRNAVKRSAPSEYINKKTLCDLQSEL